MWNCVGTGAARKTRVFLGKSAYLLPHRRRHPGCSLSPQVTFTKLPGQHSKGWQKLQPGRALTKTVTFWLSNRQLQRHKSYEMRGGLSGISHLEALLRMTKSPLITLVLSSLVDDVTITTGGEMCEDVSVSFPEFICTFPSTNLTQKKNKTSNLKKTTLKGYLSSPLKKKNKNLHF